MKRVGWQAVCVGVATLVLAGCTSSGPGKQSASVSAPAPSASAPTTSASPTPTPTPTAPLSPFEQDPAVKALRAWAAQAGRTVNTGHYTDATLRTLMTASFASTMKNVLGSDVGLHYPGPLPFEPISVRDVSASTHTVRLCGLAQGFAVAKAGKPAAAAKVLAIDAAAVQSNGRWIVSQFNTATFSCAGVTIRRPTW